MFVFPFTGQEVHVQFKLILVQIAQRTLMTCDLVCDTYIYVSIITKILLNP